MKKTLIGILAGLALSIGVYAGEAKEIKKVCVDKIVNGKPVKDKAGKVVQTCKTMKVHKKLEGTPVPPKK